MSDGWIHFPDDAVEDHVYYHPHEIVPYGFHVFVMKPEGWPALQAWWDDGEPFARTTLHNFPDGQESISEMYFRSDYVYVGMVAHEALHLAHWMLRVKALSEGRHERYTLGREPEAIAELVGALTSIIWYNLESAGLVTTDE